MNTRITLLLLAFLVISTVGCGSKKSGTINTVADLKGKVFGKVLQGTSNQNVESMIGRLIGEKPKEVIYFNRSSDIAAALLSGKIDAFVCHNFVADYLMKRNSNLKAIPITVKVDAGFIMAVRKEDQKLKEDLDSAITILQTNGTMKALIDKWINNFPANNEPSNNEIAKIEGANTLYVGVCGDYPPLDYIAANGHPAGYNVALLSEIGKILKINFEFVSMENEARFAALSSKKIDVIFTHFMSNTTKYFEEYKNDNWIGTKPYYTYNDGCFLVRK
jgi:polar amino acid transport system substrate-binding protein